MLPRFCVWQWLVFVLALVAGCEQSKVGETELGIQQNHFIQSLRLVEGAGAVLQQPGVKDADIQKALQQMDQGISQAFQVEDDFLRGLDLRLPKYYQQRFIPGVEQYRLGVESADRQQQLEGLNLLNQWGKFWQQEQANIMQKLQQLNG
jgi:hypothetical protein